MKKIFAICFYFILCFDKYSFNSVGDKVDYVREILKNQKKNQSDTREFAATGERIYHVRLNYGKDYLEQQKWSQTINNIVYKTMNWQEYFTEKTFSWTGIFFWEVTSN